MLVCRKIINTLYLNFLRYISSVISITLSINLRIRCCICNWFFVRITRSFRSKLTCLSDFACQFFISVLILNKSGKVENFEKEIFLRKIFVLGEKESTMVNFDEAKINLDVLGTIIHGV